MAMAAIKLPIVCRSFVGGMRRNAILVQRQYECAWSWRYGFHGLPEDGSVSYLHNSVNGAEVYLVGTNHISEKSAQLVKQVISFVNPTIIAIALEECKRLEAQLFLIDEDINVTTGKLCDALSFRSLLRIINKNKKRLEELDGNVELEDLIENMTKRDFVRKVTEDLKSDCPDIVRVVITDRDQIMFDHLRKCNGKVVAVVGMGHMDGIEQMWKHTEQYFRRIDG